MMLMTERHLLFARDVLLGCVGRPIDGINHAPKSKESKNTAYQQNPKDAGTGFSKNLGHELAVCENRVSSLPAPSDGALQGRKVAGSAT
jgi:hypothetical protein